MDGKRLLLTTWQGGGNVPPELGLARRLVSAGYQVRVLSEPSVEADALAVGCSFTSWPTAPSMAAYDRDAALIKDWQVRNPIGLVRRMGSEVLFGPAGRYARDVLDTLARHPADAVLADIMQFGALIGGERSGLPVVGLLPSIYVRPTSGSPVMGSGWSPARGPIGRARDALAPAMLVRLLQLGLPRLNDVRMQLDLSPLTEVLQMWDRCARLLVMTSPSFDPPPAQLPPNVRYVGPITDDPPWVGSWTPPWPLADRPFVLVAMSSTYQAHQEVLGRVVAALRSLPVYGLVTLGPALRSGEVAAAPNVAVAGSAPHSTLLRHAAAVVTHAGHGSVIKALAAGIPLICIPQGRDQKDNAARVVAAGAGIRVPRQARPRRIRQAVQQILTNASYSVQARRLAEAFAAEAGSGPDAVAEVHAVLRHERLDQG